MIHVHVNQICYRQAILVRVFQLRLNFKLLLFDFKFKITAAVIVNQHLSKANLLLKVFFLHFNLLCNKTVKISKWLN